MYEGSDAALNFTLSLSSLSPADEAKVEHQKRVLRRLGQDVGGPPPPSPRLSPTPPPSPLREEPALTSLASRPSSREMGMLQITGSFFQSANQTSLVCGAVSFPSPSSPHPSPSSPLPPSSLCLHHNLLPWDRREERGRRGKGKAV